MDEFASDISRHVWQSKYRFADRGVREGGIADTWRRVARASLTVAPGSSASSTFCRICTPGREAD